MILNRPRGIASSECQFLWCRCLTWLVQVWKKGGDLRQRSAREAISWRRSPAENHTCAMDRHHLRPEPPSPAPGTTVTCTGNHRHLRREQPSLPPLLPKLVGAADGERIGWCSSQSWCRYRLLLVQVPGISGAGVEKGVQPAPTERTRGHIAAQVPCRKPHLRQKSSLPAPQTATTCARIIHHLHHLPPASRGVDCRLSWSVQPKGSELVGRGEKVLGEKVLGKKGTRREWMFPESYPRKPTRDSSTKSRVEGRTMRMSA
jgi:hypothetical protein